MTNLANLVFSRLVHHRGLYEVELGLLKHGQVRVRQQAFGRQRLQIGHWHRDRFALGWSTA